MVVVLLLLLLSLLLLLMAGLAGLPVEGRLAAGPP